MRRLPRRPPALDPVPPPAAEARDRGAGATPVAAAPPRVVHVVVAPVLVGIRICRVVAPVVSQLEVQEWMGEYWLPSQLPLYDVRAAPRATPEQLQSAGVPPHEWGTPPAELEIVSASQLLLVAMLMSAEARAAERAGAAE